MGITYTLIVFVEISDINENSLFNTLEKRRNFLNLLGKELKVCINSSILYKFDEDNGVVTFYITTNSAVPEDGVSSFLVKNYISNEGFPGIKITVHEGNGSLKNEGYDYLVWTKENTEVISNDFLILRHVQDPSIDRFFHRNPFKR